MLGLTIEAYRKALTVFCLRGPRVEGDGVIGRHRAYRLLTVSFFFARSLLVRVTIFCASSMVSTESFRPENQPIPLVHRAGAVVRAGVSGQMKY
mgnify:CR=1 FL=1